MALIVVGSMAFDAIETPFGKSDKIIGGAATYIAWAASNFIQPVQQISVVGYDFPQEELDQLRQRGVDVSGVQIIKDRKSFFWSGKYHMDMNARDTLVTELNVLGDFNPVVPENYQGSEFLMLGNLAPAVQLSVINQLKTRPRLIAMDTMNFWMESQMDDLNKVLKQVDAAIINDAEARELSGEYSLVKAAKKISDMGPRFLIIKKENMALCCFVKIMYSLLPHFHWKMYSILPARAILLPAASSGYLAKTKDISFDNMKTAIIIGSALASFCVEKFGTDRLREITKSDIDTRIRQFVDLVQFDIDLV